MKEIIEYLGISEKREKEIRFEVMKELLRQQLIEDRVSYSKILEYILSNFKDEKEKYLALIILGLVMASHTQALNILHSLRL